MLTRFIPKLTSRKLRSLAGLTLLAAAFSSTAAAEDDLEMLLSELSFGEAPQAPTLESAGEGIVEEVQPPELERPNQLDDVSSASDQAAEAGGPVVQPAEPMPAFPGQQGFTGAELQLPPTGLPPEPAMVEPEPAELPNQPAQPSTSGSAPAGEPWAPAQPTPEQAAPPEPVPADVDFAEVFNDPAACASDAVLGMSHGHVAGGYCQPRRPPVLPQPSSLLQYFRASPCYSGVWAGYQRECHERCLSYHDHLHGTCDCFTSKHDHCDNCSGAVHAHQHQASCGCNE